MTRMMPTSLASSHKNCHSNTLSRVRMATQPLKYIYSTSSTDLMVSTECIAPYAPLGVEFRLLEPLPPPETSPDLTDFQFETTQSKQNLNQSPNY